MTSTIRADFDRIARLPGEYWDHNRHYHDFLLGQLPAHCEYALDIGCGTGSFSRLLAARSDRVLALDLSSQMIAIARKRSKGYTNIDFQVADAKVWDPSEGQFDCIASIATMHHLPMGAMLAKMGRALTAEGRLAILDLYEPEGWTDTLCEALALPVSMGLRLLKTRRLGEPRQVQAAWAEHGRHDSYLTLARIRRTSQSLLPGVQVRRHLLWRYSLVWKKGASVGMKTKDG
jgi:SAM-dependent methyltransferase